MLDHANYDQAVKLVNDEAFSKNADGAARYFAALPTIPAGILYLKPIRFEVVNEGKSVNWMEYSVTAIVPASLVLAAGLNPNERPCPSHALGSLPARSPSFGSSSTRHLMFIEAMRRLANKTDIFWPGDYPFLPEW